MSGHEQDPASRRRPRYRRGPGRARRRLVCAALAFGTVAVALAGPRARMGSLDAVPDIGDDPDAYLAAREASVPGIRPGDGKGIVWADPVGRGRTPVALVYLHGFSADRHEVEPLVSDLGGELGANVFFTRLTGHGRGADAMGEASVDAWLRDAAEALEIGRAIGERVVLIGTSTGATLAVWAAGDPRVSADVAALVLLSPNFHPRDRMSRALLWPWGGALARVVEGRERCFATHGDAHARHWTECYPTSALLPMMALTEHVRTAPLERIRTPTLIVYVPDDRVVDAEQTERAYARLGASPKALFAVEDPGDPERHVPAGEILSPGATRAVGARIRDFLAGLSQ